MAKEKDEEEEKLRDEALTEWVSRGRAAQDFTMEKMMTLWDQEDEEEEEFLADKQELMKGYQMLGPMVDQANDAARHFKETAIVEANKALATAWKYAELPPLRRRRLLRQHVVHVHEMDAETQKYSQIHQRVAEELKNARQMEEELHFGLKKRNKRHAPLLNRFQELKAEADRVEHDKALEEIEQRRRERIDKVMKETQRQVEEKEQKTRQLVVQRRHRNIKFWQKQLVQAREFAQQQTHERERKEEFDRKVEEEESLDAQRAFERLQTRSSIGMFDTAFEPGEWNSATDGGHRTGLDEHTVGISTTRGFVVENELRRMELMEIQSKVLMLREKLGQVEQAKTTLGLDMRTLLERKDQMLQEIKQVRAEQDELNEVLAGPPRRDPSEREKQQFHTLVTRRAAYMKQLGDLDSRIGNIQKRTVIVHRSETAFLPMLREAEEKLANVQAEFDAIEKERHELPVVVGKAIFQPEGMAIDKIDDASGVPVRITEPFVDPTKLLNQVTMESKFEILKSAIAPVNEHYKKAKMQAIESWKVNEYRSLAEQELDGAKARLVKIQDRFVDLQTTGLRSDIVHAIQKYHQDGNKLRQCIFPLKGQIEWWSHQMPKKSMGLTYAIEQNCITLGEGETTGKITGCFHLPKRCFYRIQMSVTIQSNSDDKPTQENLEEPETPEDWKLYIGPEMDSLQHFKFRDLGGKILRAGDNLTFEFSGIRLCFSLEISHRGIVDPKRKKYRYAIHNVARYEERLEDFREEENRVRLVQKDRYFVSELIKTMRMQSKKTSSQRTTELLQELIQVKKSTTKMWDSTLFHGHYQRFKRAEYVSMLLSEIKKEIAVQIDYSIAVRQGRVSESEMLATGNPIVMESSLQGKRKEDSRMDFQARKSALMEPKRLAVQKFLGDYCSFKSQTAIPSTSVAGSYRKETLIMGVRYEWREARTKLHVMHKLCGPSSCSQDLMDTTVHEKTEWYQLDNANAVFLASSCARALRRKRREEAEARVLLVAKDAKIEQLQQETQQNIQEENEAAVREAREDEMASQQMQNELARREKLFYADAIRLTTYNENVSSQIDFQVQRKLNVLGQQTPEASDSVVHEVKENFARQFVQGKLALVKKTWERKTKRVVNKRVKARKEREFRIRQEETLTKEVNESNERELAALKSNQEQRAKEELLRIPNFQAAVEQAFECEHVELKAWGTRYDFGLKCKKCGKEMSKSCDDPDHARGGDPVLDEDVRVHRAQSTSGIAFRFKDADHLGKVENERLRLEKEARSIEELEVLMYDRLDPKSIDDLNYRHGINRGTLLGNADSSDPLYPRLIQDIHRASHQDEILFHGRLRNFNFRIQQIFRQHAECTNRLEIQRAFLENVQRENEVVLKKLPQIEADHARAVALIEEDEAVFKSLEQAKRRRTAAQKEREAAYYAIEGVEEEAEFSEFHAPALIKSSDEMKAIYDRIQGEFEFVSKQIGTSKERLEKAEEARNKVDLMNRLCCRTQNSVLRTKFGFVKVEYFRVEDKCVVVTPLHWEATLFIPMDEILAYEAMYKEEERFAMADEDARMLKFMKVEHEMEVLERHKMAIEDQQIREIMAWRAKKEAEETLVTKVICQDELESQFVYEMDGRITSFESARKEAMKLQQRGRVYPPRIRRPLSQRASHLDAKRVARASEKRLAMASIEQFLLVKESQLRHESKRERDAIAVETLAREVFGELLADTINSLAKERLQQDKHEAQELLRAKGSAIIVTTDESKAQGSVVSPLLGLDRLWIARKQKYSLMHVTWGQEFAKLQLVRDEMARREELRRLAEEERILHEARRKEMLAEERLCRKFYVEETVLYMQERKAMANAEIEMREYIRQLELETMKTKYSKMVTDRNRVNDKAARRLEIKLGKNEQHRLHREWRQIKLEEELSMQIREKEIADALAEALERQFDKYLADQLLHGKVTAEMEASRLSDRLREAQQVAAEKRKAFEMKMVQERMIATVETFYALSRAEVEWMDAIERAKFWEHRALPLAQNLQLMEPELKRIQEEREHVVNDATSKRKYADECRKRIENADTSLARAIQEKDKAEMKYKRVHQLNATIDSEVLHDRVQRFRTSYLRDRLHAQYFAMLTDSIVRRALVECSEREIVRLETQLKQLEQERIFKSMEVSVLQRKRRRTLRMRLRRAELGKLMFGPSQQRVLKQMFQRWTKLWSERTRVRASFKVKHALLLQKQKLTMTTSSPMMKKQSLLLEVKAAMIPTRLSIMHDHQRRVLQCRLCRQKYSEEQNNRYSCVYHPGTYEFACVRTCETRQNASSGPAAVPASCMMHRAKRWLCCDETDEGRYGSSGCSRRFHLPARNNPQLENLVDSKTAKEQSVLDQINQQLLELRERNVVGKLKFATKSVVTKMEQDLGKQRATAAKFHTLDRRS